MKRKWLYKFLSPNRQIVPYVVLLSTLLLTALATYYVESTARAQDRLRFDSSIQRTENLIRDHVKTYIALLRAGSGLFAAQETVDREEFRAYMERLQLREEYRGIQGIGFSIRFSPLEKDQLIDRMRQEGSSNFAPYPDYPRPEYHAIIYLEPLDQRNQAAIGFDMFSEPVRRKAMERARDAGLPIASGRVILRQEIDQKKQAGFLIYFPIYQGNSIPPTVAERRQKLLGFIYSPFRMGDLMQGLFGSNQESLIDFEIYDGLAITPAHLLYDSTSERLFGFEPRFERRKMISIAGQTWTIKYTSRPELDFNSQRLIAPYIALSGSLVGIILFGLMRSQIQARGIAEKTATELRKSEKALRDSEARFQAFMDYSPAIAWICDRPGRMLYFSKSYTQTFNISQDALGTTVVDLFPPHLASEFLDCISIVASEKRVLEVIQSIPRRDGTMGEFLVYQFPIWDAYGQPLVGGVAIDRTESRQAEALLRRSEVQYRTMVEQSPLSILILSVDGSVQRVNRAWEDLWGIKGENIKDYNLFNDQQFIEKGIISYIKRGFAGESVTIPPILYDPHKTFPGFSRYSYAQRWVQAYIYPVRDEIGQIREVVFIYEDITERKHAEEELQESEARFRTLIETTFDGIIIHENGMILDANQGAAIMFDCCLENMIGSSFLDFVTPDSQTLILHNLQKNLEAPVEAVGLKKDGIKFNLEIIGRPHVYKGRQVQVTALRDITNRKQLEAQLRTRAEELAEANRLKDEFLATLSHELRTPLNAMLGWTQLLMSKHLDPETFNRATETINRNTRSLAQLIEDLLDVSRIMSGKLHLSLAPTSLIPIIEAAIDTVRPAAEAKNIKIHVSLQSNIGIVMGDSNRLQQVIWNLLTNAVKFSSEGGKIEVRLGKFQEKNFCSCLDALTQRNRSFSEGFEKVEYGEIQVSDTGQGISPDFLPFVFERFRQADGSITRKQGGLGLGLAIVRHLVELHGGTVSVDSPGLGQGTTFTVKLPFMTSELLEENDDFQDFLSDNDLILESCLKLKEIRVLVVDDEVDARDLVAHILQNCGANVVTAGSAEEAFNLLKDNSSTSPFHILVSDIGMPQGDGYSLLRRIRLLPPEEGGQIPALALTAYAKAEDRTAAFSAGFHAHLAKPVESHELLFTVANLVGIIG
ncbi:hybrid sensor histidine kinase/response regulator [Planktothrix mougeotii]|uniref:histidine kinase n=1 Tax=Planktothrix mougeotii LEGE 06226 TaxID=1828728 RepID=A0ABR9U946_9CYAN|nr:CHASE domain-containing protein [Planktothrix mougeotii]MBE9142654.1 CHASE domain-containing protein [Planktothrix mougeotii LEGE 06226]